MEMECSSSSTRVYKLNNHANENENENVGGEDIISNLPQDILHHIFTFLDTKQAIQTTCLLSKSWRYFWVSIPTLKFSYGRIITLLDEYQQGRRNTNANELMDFVDRVLMFRGNSNIHEFALVTNNTIDLTHRLNTWILVCKHYNVQKLIIQTLVPKGFHLHHCLFTCKSLTELFVRSRVRLTLPADSITLPSLKALSLYLVTFEDGEKVMDRLFSSCPVLESLILKYCVFPHDNINISSSQLQHLVIQDCQTRTNLLNSDSVDIKFKLCAPNLISFCYNDCLSFLSRCCDLKNLCSLVKADINIYIHSEWSKKEKSMYVPRMVNILRELHNVEDLTLSTSFLEVIPRASDLLDNQPMKFSNLRCLTLKLWGFWRSVDYIHTISQLLKISPNMDTLAVKGRDQPGNLDTDLLDMQPTHFSNVKCLKMDTMVCRDCIYAMACLLKICPNTETLSYTVLEYFSSENEEDPYCDEINTDLAIERDYWEAGLSLECLLKNLKCFELRDVTGRINQLEFLEILLKNAMQLDKLLIVFEATCSDTRHIKFSEKVLTFPRASPSVVILFKFSEKVL